MVGFYPYLIYCQASAMPQKISMNI